MNKPDLASTWNEMLQAPKKEPEYQCTDCRHWFPDSQLKDIPSKRRDILLCKECEDEFWKDLGWRK